jgi:hypothetical protein
LFFSFFLKNCKCYKRRTFVTLATIAHIFAGVDLTYQSVCSCCFCGLFAGESFFWGGTMCGEAIVTGVHRCIPYGTTLHTGANIAQTFGGMYKLVIDTKKARNLHAFQPFLPFLLLFTIAGGNGG